MNLNTSGMQFNADYKPAMLRVVANDDGVANNGRGRMFDPTSRSRRQMVLSKLMGTDCRVIIEHLPVGWEPGDQRQQWFCVVNASGIVDRHDVLFARLTGIRDEAMESWQAKPVTPVRGMPQNASEDSRREIGSAGVITWATPAEIDRVFKPIELDESRWGWRFVRDTVRLLASHYGEDRVRLVIGVSGPTSDENAITAGA